MGTQPIHRSPFRLPPSRNSPKPRHRSRSSSRRDYDPARTDSFPVRRVRSNRWRMRRAEVCPLAEIRFAEKNRSSVAQLAGDERISWSNRSLESERSCCRRHSIAGIDVVLEKNRNSMQWTARSSRCSLAVECVGYRECIRIRFQYVVQRRASTVQRFDPGEILLGNRTGRPSFVPPCRAAAGLSLLLRDRMLHRPTSRDYRSSAPSLLPSMARAAGLAPTMRRPQGRRSGRNRGVASADVAAGQSALLQILLVVILCFVERRRRCYFRHDGAAILAASIAFGFRRFRRRLLLIVVIKNRRAVLLTRRRVPDDSELSGRGSPRTPSTDHRK
jgi:hypothetical protein